MAKLISKKMENYAFTKKKVWEDQLLVFFDLIVLNSLNYFTINKIK